MDVYILNTAKRQQHIQNYHHLEVPLLIYKFKVDGFIIVALSNPGRKDLINSFEYYTCYL